VDIDGPLTEDGECVFCDHGNALALDILEKARTTIKIACLRVSSVQCEGTIVWGAIRRLYAHTKGCHNRQAK
jgi:hypothetical protein